MRPPRLSVLVPTVHAWPAAERALESITTGEEGDSFEILLLDGDGAALEREPDLPVRWIRAPGADVFELRALGIAQARGEVVAIVEDHCVMPPGWRGRTLSAHGSNSSIALIGPVSNHPDSALRAVDRANFLLTLGPFAPPLASLTRWRLPVPTNISFKRSALPKNAPPPGWLEYEFLAELRDRGEIGIAPDALLEHRQSWSPLHAPIVHFHSGRSFGALIRAWPRPKRRIWFRGLRYLPRQIYWMTKSSLERGAAGAPPGRADRYWLKTLILANSFGQLVGALAGAGTSRRRLV